MPGNLHIIGTMNTADRSILPLDPALRRRFDHVEMLPDPDHPLIADRIAGIDLRKMLKAINARISLLMDRERQIGHTYLFNVTDTESLAAKFRNALAAAIAASLISLSLPPGSLTFRASSLKGLPVLHPDPGAPSTATARQVLKAVEAALGPSGRCGLAQNRTSDSSCVGHQPQTYAAATNSHPAAISPHMRTDLRAARSTTTAVGHPHGSGYIPDATEQDPDPTSRSRQNYRRDDASH